MPSSLSHAVAGVALAAAMAPRSRYKALALAGVVCATVPDLDALPRLVGGGDVAFLAGHRGFTHSVLFALAAAAVLTSALSRRLGVPRWRMFAFGFAATMSHGVLDAFTNYGSGEGVAFFSPFSGRRFLTPWQPIAGEFSELLLCLVPLTMAAVVTLKCRALPTGFLSRRSAVRLGLDPHSTRKDPGS